MLYQTIIYELSFSEFPDDQPPATSYPERDEQAPLNPNPDIPGTDAPGVNTGSKMVPDLDEADSDFEEETENG